MAMVNKKVQSLEYLRQNVNLSLQNELKFLMMVNAFQISF